MKVRLLKDQFLHKGGMKKKKGLVLIVHSDFGRQLIKAKKAELVKENKLLNIFKIK